jgi:sec-independent protein translocase protein TatA
MFRSFGAPELLIILAVVLLLFGATRLPKVAQSIGQAMREFKKGSEEENTTKARKGRRASPKDSA